jgi:hypothetical protein
MTKLTTLQTVAAVISATVAVVGIVRRNGPSTSIAQSGVTQLETTGSIAGGQGSNFVVVQHPPSNGIPPWLELFDPRAPHSGPPQVSSLERLAPSPPSAENKGGDGFACMNSPGAEYRFNEAYGNRNNGFSADACPGAKYSGNFSHDNGHPSK